MNPSTSPYGRLTAVVLSAALATGCASIRIGSFVERGVDIRQYHSYSWGPPDTFSTGDPRLDNNRFFDERVRAQVEKALAARGFSKAAAGDPDLLVHYHASVAQEIDVRNIDTRYGYCAQADCRPFVYDAGTLFVDLVDPGTNKVVWRGWAEGSVDGVIDNQAWMEARIDEAVARILAKLPQE